MLTMNINTDYLNRCIQTLIVAFEEIQQQDSDEKIIYGIYRTVCVQEFEIVLEQCGNLLKKRLRPYFASNRQADRLNFRDIFRHAAKHGLIAAESCERWLEYRDNRNDTAHQYGRDFAAQTLKLLPRFIADAKELANIIGADYEDGSVEHVAEAQKADREPVARTFARHCGVGLRQQGRWHQPSGQRPRFGLA